MASVNLREIGGTHGITVIPPGSDMTGSEELIAGDGRRRERATTVAPTKKVHFWARSSWAQGTGDGAL